MLQLIVLLIGSVSALLGLAEFQLMMGAQNVGDVNYHFSLVSGYAFGALVALWASWPGKGDIKIPKSPGPLPWKKFLSLVGSVFFLGWAFSWQGVGAWISGVLGAGLLLWGVVLPLGRALWHRATEADEAEARQGQKYPG